MSQQCETVPIRSGWWSLARREVAGQQGFKDPIAVAQFRRVTMGVSRLLDRGILVCGYVAGYVLGPLASQIRLCLGRTGQPPSPDGLLVRAGLHHR